MAKARACQFAAALAVLAATASPAAPRTAAIDAKEASLTDVVRLLVAQGAPPIAVHPDLAERKVTFAAKAMTTSGVLRWLCRTQGLVVFRGKDRRLVISLPKAEPLIEKDYKVVRLVPTQEEADALVNFIKRVIFVAHPIRGKGDDGAPVPAFEAVCDRGKLQVAGTAAVQREVLALLRAMSKARAGRSMEDLRVPYEPYEIGFFGGEPRRPSPKLGGNVTLSVTDVPVAEAVWALTSVAPVSFFADPWEPAFAEMKVSLEADKAPLADVAKDLAAQLGAERCWYDGAWVFVRPERRPLFESFHARVYNISGAGPLRRMLARAGRDLSRAAPSARGDLPFAIESAHDLLLISGPAEWHDAARNFVRNGLDFRRFMRPPRRGGQGKGK